MKTILVFLFSIFSVLSADETPLKPQIEEIEDSHTVPQFEIAFKKMLWSLLALGILVIITIWMIKRLMKVRILQSNRSSRIKILEKRMLSPKSVLYIIEIGKKQVLITESHLEIKKIETLNGALEEDVSE